MHKLNSTLQRILWLIYVEIRYKLPVFGLMFLVCFAILMFYYWNPSWGIGKLIDELTSQSYATVDGVIYRGDNASSEPDLKYHIEYFQLAFRILGLAIISVLFSEYGAIKSRLFSISLPASPNEKWIAKIVLALVVYPIVFLVIYQLYAQVTYYWGSIRGYDFVRLGLFDPLVWLQVVGYLLIGSIVIGLATYFRKLGLVKTGLFGLIGYFVLSLVLSIISLVVFPDFDPSLMSDYFSIDGYKRYVFSNGHRFTSEFIDFTQALFSPLVLAILAIGSLVLSYFKFYELEA